MASFLVASGLVGMAPKIVLQKIGVLEGFPEIHDTAAFEDLPVRMIAGDCDPAHTAVEQRTMDLLLSWGANAEMVWLPGSRYQRKRPFRLRRRQQRRRPCCRPRAAPQTACDQRTTSRSEHAVAVTARTRPAHTRKMSSIDGQRRKVHTCGTFLGCAELWWSSRWPLDRRGMRFRRRRGELGHHERRRRRRHGASCPAQEVLDQGLAGALYCPGAETDCTLDNIVTDEEWHGPDSTPEPVADKSIVIIPVVLGGAPLLASDGVEEAAKELGWKTTVIGGQGTPDSYQEAFQSALAQSPDAIVTVSIPESQIGNYIQQSRDAGVKLVEADGLPPESGDKYDAYVSDVSVITAKIEAWKAIADSNGTAKALLFWDPSAVSLSAGLDAATAELESCGGCEIIETYKHDSSLGADATKETSIVTSLLQKHGDNLEYFLTGYGFGLPAVATTVGGCNCDTKVLTKNGEQGSLELVEQDLVLQDAGTSSAWIGWGAVDQLIRLFADEDPLGPYDQGLAVHVFDKTNLPPDNLWEPEIDFRAEYRKLWGLG